MNQYEIIMDILQNRGREQGIQEKRLHLENNTILYLDILGYKQHIITHGEQEFLKIINDVFLAAKLFIKHNTLLSDDVKYKIFSDNIVICLKNTGYNSQTLMLIFLAMQLQFYFLVKGVLVRGAITTGQLYLDDEFIYGSGLIKAYHLEDKCAIHPRIIVEHEFYDNFPSHIDNDFKLKNKQDLFRKDADGYFFIDYLNKNSLDVNRIAFLKEQDNLNKNELNELNGLMNEFEFFRQNLEIFYKVVTAGLKNNIGNESVMNKFLWCKDYYNKICELCNIPELQVPENLYNEYFERRQDK